MLYSLAGEASEEGAEEGPSLGRGKGGREGRAIEEGKGGAEEGAEEEGVRGEGGREGGREGGKGQGGREGTYHHRPSSWGGQVHTCGGSPGPSFPSSLQPSSPPSRPSLARFLAPGGSRQLREVATP
jgi:hypothetical protein